jgi:hypothetical protein
MHDSSPYADQLMMCKGYAHDQENNFSRLPRILPVSASGAVSETRFLLVIFEQVRPIRFNHSPELTEAKFSTRAFARLHPGY